MKHLTTAPNLDKVPPEWRPVLMKALAKDPTHRYQAMADMARDVAAIGQVESAPVSVVTASGRVVAAKAEEPPALPAQRPTPRQRVMELSWSLVLAVVFAGLGTLLSDHGRCLEHPFSTADQPPGGIASQGPAGRMSRSPRAPTSSTVGSSPSR